MEALVLTGAVAQVRGSSVAGDRALEHARQGRGVVATVGDGGVAKVVVVSHDGGLREQSGLFEVTVGGATPGIFRGHQILLCVCWKGVAPHARCAFRVVVDSTHSNLGSVCGSKEEWELGDNFRKVSGALGQVLGQ